MKRIIRFGIWVFLIFFSIIATSCHDSKDEPKEPKKYYRILKCIKIFIEDENGTNLLVNNPVYFKDFSSILYDKFGRVKAQDFLESGVIGTNYWDRSLIFKGYGNRLSESCPLKIVTFLTQDGTSTPEIRLVFNDDIDLSQYADLNPEDVECARLFNFDWVVDGKVLPTKFAKALRQNSNPNSYLDTIVSSLRLFRHLDGTLSVIDK